MSSVRNMVLAFVLAVVALFAAQNWPLLRALPEGAASRFLWLRLGVAPGVVLLAAIAMVALLYVLFLAQLRTASLVETRRWARELEGARRLADEAEQSRFEALKGYLEAEMGALETTLRDEIRGASRAAGLPSEPGPAPSSTDG